VDAELPVWGNGSKRRESAQVKHKSLLNDEQRSVWRRFMRVQAELTRQLDDELRAEVGIGLNALEVLWLLAIARGNRLRMTDLADHLVFTRGGVTRLVDRLERDGLVCRENVDEDLRGRYTILTRKGFDLFEEAARSHVGALGELFFDKLNAQELKQFNRLLCRVGEGLGEPS
jgi:DNA-binding MarR family transcriptional regulator